MDGLAECLSASYLISSRPCTISQELQLFLMLSLKEIKVDSMKKKEGCLHNEHVELLSL